jgi:quinoprotein glucose dehydrogenase
MRDRSSTGSSNSHLMVRNALAPFPYRRLSLTHVFLLLALSSPGHAQSHISATKDATAHTSWQQYGGASDEAQYSALKQINRANVKQLTVAWTYPTGDGNNYRFNPIMVDGRVYVLAKNNSIVSLDAATGKEIWVHPTDPDTVVITNRGFSYWESKDKSDRRLLFAANHFLQALDARTGQPILSFGENGRVDLKVGLGRDPKDVNIVQSLTPGTIFENLIIEGSATGQEYDCPPGDVRAYDVRTGKLVWTFHTIPHPGEFGYDTWPKDAWKKVGGADAWSELSIDEKRGIVYIPTASPKYNFYGGDRIGADLFGDCLIALDARTGKRVWDYQMVHHDIWDYDNDSGPKLLTVRHDGKLVDVVAEASKIGFVYVFDRTNGKPLWPIEERPVPQSDIPGEQTWPTQPFPVKPPPFARQKFTVDDITPYLEDTAEREHWRNEIANARNEGLFTPPALVNTVQMPGNVGGANWGTTAADPETGTFYVVSKDFPTMLKLQLDVKQQVAMTGTPEQRGHAIFTNNCQLCHGADRSGQPPAIPSLVNVKDRRTPEQIRSIVRQGLGPMPAFGRLSSTEIDDLVAFLANPSRAPETPAAPVQQAAAPGSGPVRYVSGFGYLKTKGGLSPIAPPWTTMTAYDLNEGTIRWQIPLGEVPELAEKGIKNTGSYFPRTGPVVTAGGLIFTGTRDRNVRAFDKDTGKLLWEKEMDAAIEGIPAVYDIGGREYVVFCVSAADTSITFKNPFPKPGQTEIHGAYVAFALPASGAQN